MRSQHNRRGGTLIDRVRHQTERHALEEAKRVPWKRLATAADEYTDWQVFSLWVRAVVEAARGIPTMVAEEMQAKAPQLVAHIDSEIEAAIATGGAVGTNVWQDVTHRAEMNIFITAKRGNWLDAVRYFSAMSLRSMKAWAHWEQTDGQWRVASPKTFPMYAEWLAQVAAVTRLSNPDGPAQHLLDCIRGTPEAAWNSLLSDFSDLIAFSLWMELVLYMEGSTSSLVSKELAKRYGGFTLADSATAAKEAVRTLNDWAIERRLGIVDREPMLAALSFHIGHHPSYHAFRNYARHCHDAWPEECSDPPPSFAEWREAADAYFER